MVRGAEYIEVKYIVGRPVSSSDWNYTAFDVLAVYHVDVCDGNCGIDVECIRALSPIISALIQ
jgi:hypothetical protein